MVGLPRLSRISRACTEMMVLIVAPTLAGGAPRVNARPETEQGGAGALGESLPDVEREPGRGDHLAYQNADRPRAQPDAALGKNLEGDVDVHRHDGHARGDGEAEARGLALQAPPGAAARAMRKL